MDAILKPGDTCWKLGKADRAAFLVDAAAYFSAFADSIRQARYVIYIAGWDFDSRIPLLRSPGPHVRLGNLLKETVKRKPGLRVYILCWKHSFVHALERKWHAFFSMDLKRNPRIRFHIDDDHPVGACHHQKFVLIDHAVAFCGGMDLVEGRWDTPMHRSDDHRRRDPDGELYKPVHDVQMVVDGAAATLFGPVFTQRWYWATGETLEHTHPMDSMPWPDGVEQPELENVQCGVSRTYPAFKGREEVREVARLYRKAIRAARRYIYMESQYFTSTNAADAISDTLQKPEGPEIVLVLPKESSNRLEHYTMDAIRLRHLRRLVREDRCGRLRIFYPVAQDQRPIYVHAKLMIVDGRLVRIGSSNLSNRSMAFDSECDLSAAGDDPRTKSGVNGLLYALLAEHLDVAPDTVSARLHRTGSLIQSIDSLRGSGRTLRRVEFDQEISIDALALVKDPDLLDPKEPTKWDRLVDFFVFENDRTGEKVQMLKPILIMTLLIGLACVWRWSPLSEYVRIENLTGWAQSIREHPMLPVIVIGVFVVGGLLMFPVSVLIVSTAIVFPPVLAGIYSLTGCLLSALAGYWAGALLGKDFIGRLTGRRLVRLSRWLRKPGIITVAVVRNVPMAPYSPINYLAGALSVKITDYLFGTAVGIAPGIIVISVFIDQLILALKEPDWTNIAVAGLTALVLGLGILWIRKRMIRRAGWEEASQKLN